MRAFKAKREVWSWLLGANAALYNPFVLVGLTSEIWKGLDLADAALMIAAAFVLRVRDPKPSGTPPKVREYKTPSRVEMYVSQYYASLDGSSQNTVQSRNVSSALLGLAFWGYVLGRVRIWRRPGRIALGAFFAGFLTIALASGVAGYARSSETSEILISIERFDPALATRLRAGKSADGAALATAMSASLARALRKAPDAAVVAFVEERFAIIHGDSPAALQRCVAAFNGTAINYQLNSNEQFKILRAMGDLYAAAAASPQSAGVVDRDSGEASLLATIQKIDPNGILDDEHRKRALTDEERCEIYTRLMAEFRSQPVKQAAGAIRAMFAE